MSEVASRPGVPVTALVATGLFFTGVTYASTLNYAAIVGIEALGISNATYAVLLVVSSLISAAASVALGWLSDRIPDRRILVIGCALMGALGFGLIYVFRNVTVYVLATCVIMPFGGALFSQSFSFARSYLNARSPERADFMVSVLRTIFAVAWAVVPPFVGWVAASSSVFEVYGIAALAYLVCAATYAIMLRMPEARLAVAVKPGATGEPATGAARLDPTIMVGILGVTLISVATYLNNVTAPLLITTTLGGSFADLGLYAGLAAALELPFMLLWGYALRWVSKHAIIIAAALLYAVYLVLLSRAGSVADVLWLQLINGPATAALMSIPISYLQDAIRGRVGLSTSLIDVVGVTAGLGSAAIFGAVTAASPAYPVLFVVAAGLATTGAIVLFGAHRLMTPRPASPSD